MLLLSMFFDCGGVYCLKSIMTHSKKQLDSLLKGCGAINKELKITFF